MQINVTISTYAVTCRRVGVGVEVGRGGGGASVTTAVTIALYIITNLG